MGYAHKSSGLNLHIPDKCCHALRCHCCSHPEIIALTILPCCPISNEISPTTLLESIYFLLAKAGSIVRMILMFAGLKLVFGCLNQDPHVSWLCFFWAKSSHVDVCTTCFPSWPMAIERSVKGKGCEQGKKKNHHLFYIILIR